MAELAAVVDHGLVPETAHDELEESADVVVRFADQDACHGRSIDASPQGFDRRDGMKTV